MLDRKVPSKSFFEAVVIFLHWFRAVQVILIQRDHSMAMSATTGGGLRKGGSLFFPCTRETCASRVRSKLAPHGFVRNLRLAGGLHRRVDRFSLRYVVCSSFFVFARERAIINSCPFPWKEKPDPALIGKQAALELVRTL